MAKQGPLASLFVLFTIVCIISSSLLIILSPQAPPHHHQNALGLDTFSESKSSKQKKGRFPSYGTPAFRSLCNWTTTPAIQSRDCVTLARLLPGSGEGLSSWVSTIAGAHIMSLQSGCRLYVDYHNVELHQLLLPRNDNLNWTVPSGFECTTKAKCSVAVAEYTGYQLKMEEKFTGATGLVPVPRYRMAFSTKAASKNNYTELVRVTPGGFDVKTGMSCSLASLLQLAPTAAQFEPRLFSTLLPTLAAPNVLSLSVYIRTGHTEHKDLPAEAQQEDEAKLHAVDQLGACALHVEQLLRTQQHTQVVWMLLTDSQLVKRVFTEKFQNASSRTVLTTSSRGAHTKPQYGPSTADFAEAFIDWYLIGETDAVIDKKGTSFGKTGAFRTQRRYFEVQPSAARSACEEQLSGF